MAGELGEHQKATSLSYEEKAMRVTSTVAKQRGGPGGGAGEDAVKGQVPGPQLVLTAPDEVSKLLVVGVVVVLDSEEHGSRDLHQRVIGCLLLLPTGVAVVEVVDFVSYLWKGSGDGINEQPEGANTGGGVKPLAGEAGIWDGCQSLGAGCSRV